MSSGSRESVEGKARWGGIRPGAGAREGNENAKKKLMWLEGYDLQSPAGIHRFLAEVIKATWTGELGSRAAGALNGTMRLLLENEILPQVERRLKLLEAQIKERKPA